MLFKNETSSLKLDVVGYELPLSYGVQEADAKNWLVLRAAYVDEDGRIIKDSNGCLLTQELSDLTAGLKVLRAGIRDFFFSDFQEPFFLFSAQTAPGGFTVNVSFALPNTMEDIDCAELSCRMDRSEMDRLIEELDLLCKKFPDRA